MNWQRGLFRLWIVGSVLFVIAVAFVSYGDIKRQFDAPWGEAHVWHVTVPQLCGEARGVAGTDYTTQQDRDPGPWDTYAKPNPFDKCWCALSKFRPLYPEYNDLPDGELVRKLYAAHDTLTFDDLIPAPKPWATMAMWATIALGIPLVVLILGSSLVWAFSGFAAKRP
jgi:hypothetical protein